MNKKILSVGLLSAMILASANANAFYVGAGVGTSKTKIDGESVDKDNALTVSTGFKIPLPLIPIRAEVEYLQFNSEEDGLDEAKTYGMAANAYVGLPLIPLIKPYVGMGLGYMQQKLKGAGFSDKSDWTVVPQYMIGLDLDLPLIPVAGGVEYRYIDTTFDNDSGEYDSKIHTFLVKGRFYF